jgi:ribosomal protein S18 acetylase RimI-like enzyme
MVLTRVATVDDAAAISDIRIRGWQSAYAGIVPDAYLSGLQDELPRLVVQLRERIAARRPYQHIVVACEGDRVVGFANAGRYRINQDLTTLDPTVGEVYAIYVDPAGWWGRGVGRALMDAAVAWLGEVGLTPVQLWVLERNLRARAFYQRYGFGFDGERGVFVIEQAGQLPVQLPELRYRLPAPA